MVNPNKDEIYYVWANDSNKSYSGLRAAPLWNSDQQRFVGMLTISDFIRYNSKFPRNIFTKQL